MLASPAPGPAQASKPDMGLRTLIPTEGPLQYNYYPVCELPTQGWGSVFPGGCQQILKTQQWLLSGLEKVSFHSNPEEGQCQTVF